MEANVLRWATLDTNGGEAVAWFAVADLLNLAGYSFSGISDELLYSSPLFAANADARVGLNHQHSRASALN